ncbi:hypothetical protein P1X14_09385 [Sphingomonas sp. AOB5]|uniref:hypothetical protein n=1 Tax=Sphingomonas sp. AOB5 TaxID=3034017 RepID=UPI0023F8739D|nr:hypothetical protein [Sphingomonas sp. AOB5]MDF7775459.1 hypothetical protein [Sphingomonas sp. AOB5]
MTKIVIELDDAEFKSLANLLDGAVRAGGLRAAKEALPITAIMEAAYVVAHPELAGSDPI